MVYWNITEVNKPCISGCFHISQFLSQGQYYLSWEGVPKLVLFIGIMVIQLVFFKGFIIRKRACYFENKNLTCQVSSPNE